MPCVLYILIIKLIYIYLMLYLIMRSLIRLNIESDNITVNMINWMKKILAFRNKNKKFTKRFTIILFFNYILLSLFSEKYHTYSLSKHLLFSFPLKQVFFFLEKADAMWYKFAKYNNCFFFLFAFFATNLFLFYQKNKYPIRVLSV